MKKWKKFLCLLLVVIMAVSLVACRGDDAKGPNPDEEGKIVINFWHSMGGAKKDAIERMAKRFNESQDKIEVVATYQGNYEEANPKIQVAIAGGTAPDLIQVDRMYAFSYAEANRLEDLRPYMQKSDGRLSPEDFVDGLMGLSYTADGKLFAIPFARSEPILYYNKDAFREVGLDPETPPKTWDDVKEIAPKLTKVEDGKTVRHGYTFNAPDGDWYFAMNLAQLGSLMINKDRSGIDFYENGIGKKVLEYWVELRDTKALWLPPAGSAYNPAQSFINGEVAMIQDSSSIIGKLNRECKFEMGVGFVPYPVDGKLAMPGGGSNLAMLSDSKHKDAAWTFIEWICNDPQGGQQWSMDSGYFPFTKKMAEMPQLKKLWESDPMYATAFDQLQYTVEPLPDTHFGELVREVNAALEAVMVDNTDIDTALAALNTRATELFAE